MFSPKTTYSDFSAGSTVTIEGGASIIVHRFILTNSNTFDADDVVIDVKNGSTVITTVRLEGLLGSLRHNVYVNVPFLADQGLSFEVTTFAGAATGSGVNVTVNHSHPGA